MSAITIIKNDPQENNIPVLEIIYIIFNLISIFSLASTAQTIFQDGSNLGRIEYAIELLTQLIITYISLPVLLFALRDTRKEKFPWFEKYAWLLPFILLGFSIGLLVIIGASIMQNLFLIVLVIFTNLIPLGIFSYNFLIDEQN